MEEFNGASKSGLTVSNEDRVPTTDSEPQEPQLALRDLATLDELYEEGELEFEEEDSLDSTLDSELGEIEEEALLGNHFASGAEEADAESSELLPREKLLLEVQKSFDYEGPVSPDEQPLVSVGPEFADEVYNFLVVHGPILFHAKYRMQETHSAQELLAALGFRLPKNVAEDPQFSPQDFDFALQIAMRIAMLRRKRLPQPRTLDEVVAAIENAKRILVVTGAGISTSLGIPDFRSDNGLYSQLRHLGLGDPQEVFDIRLFREDPSIFYSVARKILPDPALYKGTPTHQFIKMLADRGKLLRNYTQNIDNIEHHVGLDPAQVVQCHGSFGSAHCITCGFEVPEGEQLFPAIRAGEVPRCPECAQRRARGKRRAENSDDEDDEDDNSYGVLKPDITFFGESLPHRFDRLLLDEGDAFKCDLIICMGTSLKVAPVSEIVKVVRRNVPQIFVSKTPASHVVFEAMFLGNCDDTVELLAQKLNWPLDHAMNKRPRDMPETEFPKGEIRYDNGVFTFEDPEEMALEREKQAERQAMKLKKRAEKLLEQAEAIQSHASTEKTAIKDATPPIETALKEDSVHGSASNNQPAGGKKGEERLIENYEARKALARNDPVSEGSVGAQRDAVERDTSSTDEKGSSAA